MSQSVPMPSAERQNASSHAASSELAGGLTRLILIGLVTQIIYVIYIVAYPLISNTQAGGPAADLEILMRDNHWIASIYTAGLLLLYFLFWQAMKFVWQIRVAGRASQPAETVDTPALPATATPPRHYVSDFAFNRLKLFILAFGLLFGFTLVWLYPITANDLFRYVLRGRIWTVYGESPMLVPPNAYPDDPYIKFAGEFGNWVSGYGPLWEVVVQAPLQLGAVEMVPGAISLKLVVLLFYLFSAVLLGWFATPERGTSLAMLTFFAWNPLVLMQGPGNGHNDMVFMALMVLGIILWQRKLWWAAALALTLSVVAKASALLLLPLFGVVLLRSEPTWRTRIFKGAGAAAIGLLVILVTYSGVARVGQSGESLWGSSLSKLEASCTGSSAPIKNACLSILDNQTAVSLYQNTVGPTVDAFQGVSAMLTSRRGFAIASGLRMVLREIIPQPIAEPIPRTIGRYIFILFYGWLLVQVWRKKLNLVTAGFLAYFSQLMLGRTFRIWYPMWLIPLAAFHLTPATFWRTLLFGLTAELSIVNYFVVWRWWLRDFSWGNTGPLSQYWNYWTIMHLLTVPWLFGIPLFGPIILKRLNKNTPNAPAKT